MAAGEVMEDGKGEAESEEAENLETQTRTRLVMNKSTTRVSMSAALPAGSDPLGVWLPLNTMEPELHLPVCLPAPPFPAADAVTRTAPRRVPASAEVGGKFLLASTEREESAAPPEKNREERTYRRGTTGGGGEERGERREEGGERSKRVRRGAR